VKAEIVELATKMSEAKRRRADANNAFCRAKADVDTFTRRLNTYTADEVTATLD
jgi:hypothetical protein